MSYGIRLLGISEKKNLKIIIKRIAGDLRKDYNAVELMLTKFPITILSSVTEDMANKILFDYSRLGCLAEKFIDQEPKAPEKKDTPIINTVPPVNMHQSIKPKVEKKSVAFSTPNKKSSKGKNRDLFILLTIIVVSILAFYLLQTFNAKGGGSNKKSSKQHKNSSKKKSQTKRAVTRKQESKNRQSSQKSVEKAKKEKNVKRKITILKKALSKNPTDKSIKRSLSGAYVSKAKIEENVNSRIRFYLIAISFNKYNEAAWDNLIEEYNNENMYKEKREAEKEKMLIFDRPARSLGGATD